MENNKKYILSKYVFNIKRKNGYATYHSIFGNLCLLNKQAFNLLKSFKNDKTIESVLKRYKNKKVKAKARELVKEYLKRGFLFECLIDELSGFEKFVQKRNQNIKKGKEACTIQLVVTNVCNFNCKYCFLDIMYSSEQRKKTQRDQKNQMMKKQDAKKYIQTVINHNKKNGRKNMIIQFTGGEPLINWPLIKYVLEEFSNGEKHGINIQYSIDTNGSLITDEVAKYFKKYDVHVIVSFDTTHGKARPLANGQNSITLIKKNIKILNKYKNRIALNTAITTETFHYYNKKYNYNRNLVDFSMQNGVKEIGVIFELNVVLYKNYSTDEIISKFWKFYTYARENNIAITGYWYQIFQLLLEDKHYLKGGYKTCYANGPLLSIEPNGVVYTCKFSSAYIGNMNKFQQIFSTNNYIKYAKLPFQRLKYCRGCEIENFCSNICLGVREKTYGTILKIHKPTCQLYKKLVKKLIIDSDEGLLKNYSLEMN